MSEGQANGSIRISDEVIGVIVGIAVSQTPGICCTQNAGIAEFIGKRKLPKGIRVEVSDDSVSVDVAVAVEYGNRIRTIAEEVQKAVKTAISDMTGMKVGSVDVQVQSVVLPEKEAAENEENN